MINMRQLSSSRHGSTTILWRLAIYPDEVYRLPPNSQALHVLAGGAWVTRNGLDLVLSHGETASVAPGDDPALLSALGRRPLIVEILGPAGPRATLATRAA
jgi:hypothetical protein